MPTTVKVIIDTALRKLGVTNPSPAEQADALAGLKMMLDIWSLEALMVPFSVTEQFGFTAGQALYSIGTGGDWNTVRPEEIEAVRVKEADGRTYPVVLSSANVLQWQSTVETGPPCRYLVSRDARFVWIEFDSYPDAPHALITSRKPFNATALENFQQPYDPAAQVAPIYPSGFTLTGIQTPVEFPTGYESAIVYNLAVHMRPEYPGLALPEEVVALAVSAKSLIKRGNWRPSFLNVDPAIVQRHGVYDIVAGP